MQSSSNRVGPHLVDKTSWQFCDLQTCPHFDATRQRRREKVAVQLTLGMIGCVYALALALCVPLAPPLALMPIITLPHVCDWMFRDIADVEIGEYTY